MNKIDEMDEMDEIRQIDTEDISYEEEQLQKILIQESDKLKIIMDRELREHQELEYLESLNKDIEKQKETKQKEFEEPSVEEMRRVRLNRFCK